METFYFVGIAIAVSVVLLLILFLFIKGIVVVMYVSGMLSILIGLFFFTTGLEGLILGIAIIFNGAFWMTIASAVARTTQNEKNILELYEVIKELKASSDS
jgi:energy-coupling factor transporter transmembrane protein EcfT